MARASHRRCGGTPANWLQTNTINILSSLIPEFASVSWQIQNGFLVGRGHFWRLPLSKSKSLRVLVSMTVPPLGSGSLLQGIGNAANISSSKWISSRLALWTGKREKLSVPVCNSAAYLQELSSRNYRLGRGTTKPSGLFLVGIHTSSYCN